MTTRTTTKKRSLKPWIILLALPYPLLVFVMVLQMIVRAIIGTSQNSPVWFVANILSLIVGVASVIMIMGMPIWIIMLITTYEYNKK